MWWMIAAFAAKAVGSMLQGGSGKKQIEAQNKAAYAENQRYILQAGQEAGAAYAEMGAASSRATGQLAEADRISTIQRGEQTVAAAANGTSGASVMSIQYDIQRQEEQQRATLAADLQQQLDNLRSKANAAYTNAENKLVGATQGPSGSQVLFSSLLGAAASSGGNYASAKASAGSSG